MEAIQIDAGFQVLNVGGIRRLRLIDAASVKILDPARFPTGLGGQQLAAVNVAVDADAVVTDWLLLPETSEMAVNYEYGPHGYQYDTTINWEIPGSATYEVLNWLANNGARKWVALAEDRNGGCYVAGETGNGMRLRVVQVTGKKRVDTNRFVLTLSGRMTHACWLLDSLDQVGTFAPEFDLSFDLSFNS